MNFERDQTMPDLHSALAAAPTGYLRDILDQPVALRDTLAVFPGFPSMRPFAERLASGDLRRVVLTGMGSSYHALYPLALTLIARGLAVHMLETSELIHYAPALLDPRTLLVVVSQSGRSAEVVGLLERTHGRVPLVGVTNTADGPLAAQSDAVLLTRAGDEFSVSSKTYIAALAALAWLGDALAGQDTLATRRALDDTPGALEHYLAPWTDYVETLCKQLADVRYLVLVGRGPSLAAVGTGALIVKESAHFPAEGLSSAAFRHGPLELAAPDIFVLVFSGAAATAGLNARLADDVRAAGGLAALVRESTVPDVFALPPVPDIARPLLELLPVQMLSVALARLKGHEAGRFGRASKVTLTE
jgi:glucosamine--fructose-6-phosphate aminotransferase (isomerizing)